MILICTQKCFFLDRTIKPGQPCDVPQALLGSDLVKASFAKPETVEAAKAAEASADGIAAKTELSATELKRRLDDMGIAYKGNASREVLQNTYNAHMAAQADAQKD